MARSLPSWREPEAVLELATLAVAERAGAERDDDPRASCARCAAARERVRFFDMPRIDVSSSLVRERVATGAPDPLPRPRRGRRRRSPSTAGTAHERRAAGADRRRDGGGDRRLRLRQEGDRDRRARPARGARLRRLLRHLHRQHRSSGEGDPRRHPRRHEAGARAAAAPRRGTAAGALGLDGLSRRGRPRLHARDARVLPARAAVGRGPGAHARRGRGAEPSHDRSEERRHGAQPREPADRLGRAQSASARRSSSTTSS